MSNPICLTINMGQGLFRPSFGDKIRFCGKLYEVVDRIWEGEDRYKDGKVCGLLYSPHIYVKEVKNET